MWPMVPRENADPLRQETVGGMLATIAARMGAREAIVATDRRITYAELRRQAEGAAQGLLALGVDKPDTVALWLPNRPEWLFVQHGCALIGAVVVALDPRAAAGALRDILRQTGATTLLCADHAGPVDYLETLAAALPGLAASVPGELDLADAPRLRAVIVDADDPYPGCLRLRDVLEAGDAPEWAATRREALAEVTPDDPLTILPTPGTTTVPAGAVWSHRSGLSHGRRYAEVLQLTEADRVLHALPLSSACGGLAIPLAVFGHGATLVLMESPEPAVALRLMEAERVTAGAMALARDGAFIGGLRDEAQKSRLRALLVGEG